MRELTAALAAVNRSSSPGSDKITYSALAHLGDKALEALLLIYNRSWQAGHLEARWKVALIVPILKPGSRRQNLIPTGQLHC